MKGRYPDSVKWVCEFYAPPPPGQVNVGDTVMVTCYATVHRIEASLVDVTSLGSKAEYMLGEVTVALTANDAQVGLEVDQ